ncbi:MAG: acetylglutamate kinase [Desulfovibrionaceae bacterium]|nr:acetylglutamate kinase [Desulfovibrionaceae bacterium]
MEQIAVIKYGGHAMVNPNLAQSFAKAVFQLKKEKLPCLIVHGGGPQINDLLTKLNIESQFVDGLRKTDAQTMSAVEMVLAGQVNKALVAMLLKANVQAIGLSGRDGNLLVCEEKDPRLGLVGKITKVNAEILKVLLKADFTPIIAPIANNFAFEAYNINADTAAGAIAGALQAKYFVLISDVPGVLDANKKILPSLTRTEINQLIADKVISGGMLPKIESCLTALAAGAGQALILDGRQPESLSRFLLLGEPLGTLITA